MSTDLPARAIVAATETITGIGVSELWSDQRHPRIVAARAAMVAVARRRSVMSFPEINAMVLGRRGSHSTAIEALGRFNRDADKILEQGGTLRLLAQRIELEADNIAPQYSFAVGQAWNGEDDVVWGRCREIVALEPSRVLWINERGSKCWMTRADFAAWVSTAIPVEVESGDAP